MPMKRFRFLLLLLSLLPVSAHAATQTITVVADKWCPYNCDENSAHPGYMVEMLRLAMKKADIEVVYKVMPWSQAIEGTKKGEYDAVVGAAHGDARELVFPEVLQGISIMEFWVRKDSNWNYKSPSSLSGQRLGVIADYFYGKSINEYINHYKTGVNQNIEAVTGSNASELNIQKLLSGQLDIILEDKNVVNYYFASRGEPLPFKSAGNPVSIEDFSETFIYVAFSPKNPRAKYYAQLFTRGIQEMRQNGELNKILSLYHMTESYQFIGKAGVRPPAHPAPAQ